MYISACRLEGEVPVAKKEEMLHQLLGGVPGFQSPQLPKPGEVLSSCNSLKIEKLVLAWVNDEGGRISDSICMPLVLGIDA